MWLFTIYAGKPVGPRFEQMVKAKPPEWEIPFEIGVYHLSNSLQFTEGVWNWFDYWLEAWNW